MSTDRELLELAAKAAGVFMREEDWPYSTPVDPTQIKTKYQEDRSIFGWRIWICSANGGIGGTEGYTWRPLTDDGDALRLAVKLHMTVRCYMGTTVAQIGTPGLKNAYETATDHADPTSATRRAIVRAAAAIGAGIAASNGNTT